MLAPPVSQNTSLTSLSSAPSLPLTHHTGLYSPLSPSRLVPRGPLLRLPPDGSHHGAYTQLDMHVYTNEFATSSGAHVRTRLPRQKDTADGTSVQTDPETKLHVRDVSRTSGRRPSAAGDARSTPSLPGSSEPRTISNPSSAALASSPRTIPRISIHSPTSPTSASFSNASSLDQRPSPFQEEPASEEDKFGGITPSGPYRDPTSLAESCRDPIASLPEPRRDLAAPPTVVRATLPRRRTRDAILFDSPAVESPYSSTFIKPATAASALASISFLGVDASAQLVSTITSMLLHNGPSPSLSACRSATTYGRR
jgi:hypothetical protein